MTIHEFTVGNSRMVVDIAKITMLTYSEPSPVFPNGVTIITLTDGKVYRFEGANNDVLFREIRDKMSQDNVDTGTTNL